MPNKGLVSIITPVFNGEEFIMDCINSVTRQIYSHWELIIVNDCSTDGTKEILDRINNTKIKVIDMPENNGPLICRDKAQEIAQGEYIAFIDADDIWANDKLDKQLSYMKQNACDFCYSDYEIFGNNSSFNQKAPNQYRLATLLTDTGISLSSCIYRRYDMRFHSFGDHHPYTEHFFYLGLLAQVNVGKNVGITLTQNRLHSSMSSNKVYVLKYMYRIIKHNHGFNFITANYFILMIIKNVALRVIKKMMISNNVNLIRKNTK
jgi:teichuronic acid biosynthesis glycosyltransferase TuaG